MGCANDHETPDERATRRKAEARQRLDEHVARAVAAAPPLTAEQVDTIRVLLGLSGRRRHE